MIGKLEFVISFGLSVARAENVEYGMRNDDGMSTTEMVYVFWVINFILLLLTNNV